SVNLEQLPAKTVWKPQIAVFDEQIDGDSGLVAEALREPQHQFAHVRALHAQRPHVRDHAPELLALLLKRFLEVRQLFGGMGGGWRHFPAENIELDVHAQQRLENSVVQVAGNTASLGLHGARSETAQHENVFERPPDMPDDLLELAQVADGKPALGIHEQH